MTPREEFRADQPPGTVGSATRHGSRELAALYLLLAGVELIGLVGSFAPTMEPLLLAAVFAVVMALAVLRWAVRWVRERAEDRADTVTAARAVAARRATGEGVRR